MEVALRLQQTATCHAPETLPKYVAQAGASASIGADRLHPLLRSLPLRSGVGLRLDVIRASFHYENF